MGNACGSAGELNGETNPVKRLESETLLFDCSLLLYF
jgi:hypothetical protein